MSEVLAIVPARSGSKGIPNKNFERLGRMPPVERAVICGVDVGCHVVVSMDLMPSNDMALHGRSGARVDFLQRLPELALDDTPMIAVVEHVLAQIPGPPDQIIVLLQPTQPLRQPKHVQAAITLLQESQADSVVSVTALPQAHSPELACAILGKNDGANACEIGGLTPYLNVVDDESFVSFSMMPTTRQEARPAYIRDGTVYCFWRRNVAGRNGLYGGRTLPLIIPAEETCALDTPLDWQIAELRLKARDEA